VIETTAETSGDITRALREWRENGQDALENLLGLVYAELRRMAGYYFNGEGKGHTLQPTALINEIYLSLAKQKQPHFEDRLHFFQFCGTLMRRVLVDYARSRRAIKRNLPAEAASSAPFTVKTGDRVLDLESLISRDQALAKLALLDERQVRIVDLRFFAGLSIAEVSGLLKVSTTIITREWSTAKAWLAREMGR